MRDVMKVQFAISGVLWLRYLASVEILVYVGMREGGSASFGKRARKGRGVRIRMLL